MLFIERAQRHQAKKHGDKKIPVTGLPLCPSVASVVKKEKGLRPFGSPVSQPRSGNQTVGLEV
jgi:hypothetical protein